MDWQKILKVIALILAFSILFMPQEGTGWIVTLVIVAVIVIGLVISKVGIKNITPFLVGMFGILTLLSEIGTKFHKWMVALFILSLLVLILKKYAFKS